MVSSGYTNVGEEWSQKNTWRQDLITRDTTIDILLFDDATDNTGEASDIGDIQNELSGGNYARQSLTLDSADVELEVSSGALRVKGTVMFDLTDTTGTFDAYGIVTDFQSDVVNSETGQNPHLLTTALLESGPFEAGNYTGFDVQIRGDLD